MDTHNHTLPRDPETGWITTALECLRQVTPGMRSGALKLIEETLRADQQEAAARKNAVGAPPAVMWLPAHYPTADVGEATPQECADVWGHDSPTGPLRIIGYAPVAVKYAVLVPTDGGCNEIEIFDHAEAAQRLLDAMYAEPAANARQVKIVPGSPTAGAGVA